MRVLQLHTEYRIRGGEDSVVASESRLLHGAGHEVVTARLHNPTSQAGAVAMLAVAAWNPVAYRRLRDLVNDTEPDVAHVHNTWFAASPAAVAAIAHAGVPVAMTLHNYRVMCANALLFRDGHPCMDCVGKLPLAGVRHRCYRHSAIASGAVAVTIAGDRTLGTLRRHVNLFLTLSAFARDTFVAGGLAADKIRVRPNFTEDPGERTSQPSASNTVLYVGRLSREKGVDVLLRAWARRPLPGHQLVLIGEGPLARYVTNEVTHAVRYLGAQPAHVVRAAMLSARVLVFPSVWFESMPMVLVEAMAAGLPVIATRLGGTPSLLGENARPWLFGPHDDRTLATNLAKTVQAGALDAYGRVLRDRYLAHHTPELGLKSLLGVYDELRAGRT